MIYLLTFKPVDITKFAIFTSFDVRRYFGEPLLLPFYTSLNADISGTWKDIHNLQYFQSEMKTKTFELSLLKVRPQYTIWDIRFYSLL